MMRIEWDIRGFEAIRRSPEVQVLVDEGAEMLASEAGPGYGTSSMQGKSRYRSIVFAESSRAFRDQARNNTLQKVLFSKGAE